MKVKDIMMKAAELVGNADELQNYFDGTSSTLGKKQAELLLTCFNFVENELALDYIPLIKEEAFTPNGGKISYSDFSSSIVRILRVEANGKAVPFRLFAAYMEADERSVVVRYAYTPTEKAADGESEYRTGVSERLIAFGMAAEYCTALGRYEEAGIWDKKYKEGIEAIKKIGTKRKLPSRRWA